MAKLNLQVDILIWEQIIGEMPLKVITLNLLICVHAYKLGRCDFFCFYAKTFGKVKNVDFSTLGIGLIPQRFPDTVGFIAIQSSEELLRSLREQRAASGQR